MEHYKNCLAEYELAGPTKFAPVIRRATEIVNKCGDKKNYHILMIITDGDIHDMDETMQAIVDIVENNVPMSIVVVGVGCEDFSQMVRLDGDHVAIKKNMRDIVQFVDFKDILD